MGALLLTLLVFGGAPAAKPAPERLQLLGTVGALPVRMTLRLEGGQASAEYAYASGTASLALFGRGPAADGALRLTATEDAAESFQGAYDARAGRFSGTWRKGERSLPFALQVFARQVPLGGKARCGNVRVLRFELADVALAEALSARAREVAQQAIASACDASEADAFGGEQVLWAMTDGLVSIRTFTGNGLPRGSGSTSVVLDTRATPPAELRLEADAVNAQKMRRGLAREADRVLRQRDEPLRLTALAPGATALGEDWSGWAVTPEGVQLFFRMNDWGASGDGTVHVLVRRERMKGLYRAGTRLGDWVEGATAP